MVLNISIDPLNTTISIFTITMLIRLYSKVEKLVANMEVCGDCTNEKTILTYSPHRDYYRGDIHENKTEREQMGKFTS